MCPEISDPLLLRFRRRSGDGLAGWADLRPWQPETQGAVLHRMAHAVHKIAPQADQPPEELGKHPEAWGDEDHAGPIAANDLLLAYPDEAGHTEISETAGDSPDPEAGPCGDVRYGQRPGNTVGDCHGAALELEAAGMQETAQDVRHGGAALAAHATDAPIGVAQDACGHHGFQALRRSLYDEGEGLAHEIPPSGACIPQVKLVFQTLTAGFSDAQRKNFPSPPGGANTLGAFLFSRLSPPSCATSFFSPSCRQRTQGGGGLRPSTFDPCPECPDVGSTGQFPYLSEASCPAKVWSGKLCFHAEGHPSLPSKYQSASRAPMPRKKLL